MNVAEVTGPISSLPGACHVPPRSATCDEHPDRPAAARVQGETDSFGSELIDMCAECASQHRQHAATADASGRCDWCKKDAPCLRARRDWEEGMHGPVYRVCEPCVAKADAAAAEEWAAMESETDPDDDDGGDAGDWEAWDSDESDY